jgi:3-hydroxyisobutyrate dehydrogenase
VGIIGLGNMGRELATNVVACGSEVVSHDLAGPERNVAGAAFVGTVAEVAQCADVVVLSLPDGRASGVVADAIGRAAERRCGHVVDASTVGVRAAESIAALLRESGVGYVDSPVSGGPAGARARTLAVMYAGTDDDCAAVEPVLAALSDRRFRVGDRPGLAQAVKLANNFLSATALAATSEAIAFGEAVGVDMSTMLTVLSASSGCNTATSDKFPNHVVTQRYASGFTNSLMDKDLALYLAEVATTGSTSAIGAVTKSVWEAFVAADSGADFTRIYPFVRDS